mmetsp:Transcript_49534/g.105406  ORF Transcript_49534/g.105406 Transcript_49534/m.105406 type:complete len:579 (+) Transcript_49534:1985-3721(+)
MAVGEETLRIRVSKILGTLRVEVALLVGLLVLLHRLTQRLHQVLEHLHLGAVRLAVAARGDGRVERTEGVVDGLDRPVRDHIFLRLASGLIRTKAHLVDRPLWSGLGRFVEAFGPLRGDVAEGALLPEVLHLLAVVFDLGELQLLHLLALRFPLRRFRLVLFVHLVKSREIFLGVQSRAVAADGANCVALHLGLHVQPPHLVPPSVSLLGVSVELIVPVASNAASGHNGLADCIRLRDELDLVLLASRLLAVVELCAVAVEAVADELEGPVALPNLALHSGFGGAARRPRACLLELLFLFLFELFGFVVPLAQKLLVLAMQPQASLFWMVVLGGIKMGSRSEAIFLDGLLDGEFLVNILFLFLVSELLSLVVVDAVELLQALHVKCFLNFVVLLLHPDEGAAAVLADGVLELVDFDGAVEVFVEAVDEVLEVLHRQVQAHLAQNDVELLRVEGFVASFEVRGVEMGVPEAVRNPHAVLVYDVHDHLKSRGCPLRAFLLLVGEALALPVPTLPLGGCLLFVPLLPNVLAAPVGPHCSLHLRNADSVSVVSSDQLDEGAAGWSRNSHPDAIEDDCHLLWA